MTYHIPVLLFESIEGLAIKPNGIYVDVTFGGGGHSREILNQLKDGKLFAFDQDQDAHLNSFSDSNFTLIKANFRYLKNFLSFYQIDSVDGILADLGISSHQIDIPERGFSTRFDSPLDFRMDQQNDISGENIINDYSEADLIFILKSYGEIKNARKVSQLIVAARQNERIINTGQLKEIIKSCSPPHKRQKFLAQVFQAFRIEVNEEIKILEEFLFQCTSVIKPGGRLSVISYHSLEDRPVKNFMRTGSTKGIQEKDFYGNIIRPFDPLNRKPIQAGEQEILKNNRARSAKLRIAVKR